MKTIPPTCPEPPTGRTYWRSLDELSETPEFRQWVEREFPEGASEFTDPVSRRHFVKIMSASFVLAGVGLGTSGCRRPEQKILPFAKAPEDYVHGVPKYYATAMPTRAGAIPLVAKATDGRPIKIEGNSLIPDSNGGTDRYAQASILNLYDPDRATMFTKGGNIASPDSVTDFLSSLSKTVVASGGKGLRFLAERSYSPSRARLQALISEKLPNSHWHVFEPIDTDIHRRAATKAFGKPVTPVFRYDNAKVIVSLDCDFIGSEEDAHNHIRRFSSRRRVEETDKLNRLYTVESLMTLTGVNSDHRLRVPASAVAQVAAALARSIATLRITSIADLAGIPAPAGVDPKWIAECAKDVVANSGAALVVAGHRQPLAVHLLAYAINNLLGNIGSTLILQDAPETKEEGLAELAQALNGGEVESLVLLGGNPCYSAPADLDWAKAQRKAKTVVRLSYYQADETSSLCDWQLPAAHYLESWGDARTSDGILVPIQPLIAPLFGGLTELELLARIAGLETINPYDIIRETFSGIVGGGDYEPKWRKYLHDGLLAGSAAKPVKATMDMAVLGPALAEAKEGAATKDKLEVVFHRDYKLDDGRYNNNGWLQEMPDPITKMTWDNGVLISRKTAEELGVKNSDVVEVSLGGRSVRGPIWIQPGQADYSLGLSLGYGREKTGRVGQGTGFNAYALRASGGENFAVGATLRKTGDTYPISVTQDHWSLEGRPIVREANLEQYRKHPDFAKSMKLEEPPVVSPLYPNPFDKAKEKGLHQWGMSIDLNLCVGCSACTMACQSENNVPIVGKEMVGRGREMHWIRIDRYYAGPPAKHRFMDVWEKDQKEQFQEWIDEPQAVTMPMLCQHCEAAPCENVCPVNATVHDNEGLNLMVYNRCVGTRYCSNNCPYKVRRFNFFDYNKRGFNAKYLKMGPLHSRKDDEWDLLKMSKNPDVTVRMRGVMEKCSFCIQRIEQAKIAQKVKARDSADVIVPTDSFTTACAQACPAGAIVFGNLNDPESRVSKLKKLQRDYTVLEFLLTKPRLTYLAKVRNPNPAMPDYQDKGPLTLQEYEVKSEKTSGDPFEAEPAEKKGNE